MFIGVVLIGISYIDIETVLLDKAHEFKKEEQTRLYFLPPKFISLLRGIPNWEVLLLLYRKRKPIPIPNVSQREGLYRMLEGNTKLVFP